MQRHYKTSERALIPYLAAELSWLATLPLCLELEGCNAARLQSHRSAQVVSISPALDSDKTRFIFLAVLEVSRDVFDVAADRFDLVASAYRARKLSLHAR